MHDCERNVLVSCGQWLDISERQHRQGWVKHHLPLAGSWLRLGEKHNFAGSSFSKGSPSGPTAEVTSPWGCPFHTPQIKLD